MHPQAEQLAAQFKKDFFSADHSIKWLSAERELWTWLDDRTVLLGTIDAEGQTEDGDHFFADWKTIGVRSAGKNNSNMPNIKAQWRFDPQALSYGLLLPPHVRRFTVRWAVKSNPPTTDFEWYSYTQPELDWWKEELLSIAHDIRDRRKHHMVNWPTNLTNCARYGWNLRCPMFDNGCSKLNFSYRPEGIDPRDHHLASEQQIREEWEKSRGLMQYSSYHPDNSLVFLSSSSVELFLSCNEKYRRFYEDGPGMNESGEALTIGTDFHTIIKDHIKGLIINGRTAE